jgi:hypothetical protein
LRCEAEGDQIITGWTRERTKHEATAQLSAVGVPLGAVLEPMELTNEPSFRRRGILQTMTHGEPRGKPGFSTFEGGCGRETDSPLAAASRPSQSASTSAVCSPSNGADLTAVGTPSEGDGFELSPVSGEPLGVEPAKEHERRLRPGRTDPAAGRQRRRRCRPDASPGQLFQPEEERSRPLGAGNIARGRKANAPTLPETAQSGIAAVNGIKMVRELRRRRARDLYPALR